MAIIKSRPEEKVNVPTAQVMKSLIVLWARFKQGYDFALTEFCNMDVFVGNIHDMQRTPMPEQLAIYSINPIMEIEIKISKSDFLADFKKEKHNKKPYTLLFYYAVPHFMRDYCIDYIKEHNLPYGVISCNDVDINYDSYTDFVIWHSAKKREHEPFEQDSLRYLFMRMSSELADMRRQAYVKRTKK